MKWRHIIIVLLTSSTCQAQGPETDPILSENSAQEQYTIELQERQQNRVPWINLTRSLLETNPCLDEALIIRILEHENNYGGWLCKEELQTVQGMSKEILPCLEQYFIFPPPFEYHSGDSVPDECHHEISLTVRNSSLDAFDAQSFPGGTDGWQSALRYRLERNPIWRIGLNAERDPYERWWSSRGPDHVGGFLVYRRSPQATQWLVGDFRLAMGQGMLFGNSSFSSPGSETGSIKRCAFVASPITSMQERGGLRGVCAFHEFGDIRLIGFGSCVPKDGTIRYAEDSSITFISENTSGLHRSETEIAGRSVTQQMCTGIAAEYVRRSGKWGVGCSWVHFGLPAYQETQILQPERLSEESCLYTTFYAQQSTAWGLGFGECLLGQYGQWGLTAGWLAAPSPRLSLGILGYLESETLETPWGNPAGNRQSQGGERNTYFTGTYRLDTRWSLNLYTFRQYQRFADYNSDEPGHGFESGGKLTCILGKKAELYLLWNNESSQANESLTRRSNTETSTAYRTQITYQPALGWKYRFRVELKRSGKGSPSHLVYQDIQGAWKSLPIRFSFRTILYHCPDFNATIYSLENDLPYSYRSALNYGNGIRWYLMLQVKFNSIDVTVRFENDRSLDREWTNAFTGKSTGSKQEIGVCLRYRLGSS